MEKGSKWSRVRSFGRVIRMIDNGSDEALMMGEMSTNCLDIKALSNMVTLIAKCSSFQKVDLTKKA